MDSGRYHDLKALYAVLNDPGETDIHKFRARRSIAKILKTRNDKKLRVERERLIRATQAGDIPAIEKIGLGIQEHMMRTYGHV